MTVTCPACGGSSPDQEFCDHCNADLASPPPSPAPLLCPLMPEAPLALTAQQAAALCRPEASTTLLGWRLHWIPVAQASIWRARLEERNQYACPSLPPCRIVEDPAGIWVAVEAMGQRTEPWLASRGAEPLAQLRELLDFLEPLAAALEQLHACGLAWLSFHPGEIEVVPGNAAAGWCCRFTNLDLRVFPSGRSPEAFQVLTTFAAPEIWAQQAADLGPRTDVFHLTMFAYYWLAGLLPGGFPGKGLMAFDFDLPPLRTYAPALPPGIAAVISRGLEIQSGNRHPSPAALCAALREAADRAERRWASRAPLAWDIGVHTRTGRAKEARRLTNEDHVLVRQLANPERALAAVADGISICDVGSGALASWLACLVLENAFGPDSTAVSFPQQIVEACHRGAGHLLTWALERGHREQLQAGAHLMGTTLTAGWLEGNHVLLASLGDSRAYLVEADNVEQLTVDGDLASAMLAMRLPPEEVGSFGPMSRALYQCVGGFTQTDEGELVVQEQCCTPNVSSWRLLAGDVLVLCSDGLVDEGLTLEPEEMAAIVRANLALSAEEVAFLLAEAADARQRLSSADEPDGFGDNISCIVVKLGAV